MSASKVQPDWDTAGVLRATSPDGITAIHEPHCAALVWERRPLTRFQDWVDTLAPEHLPTTRQIVRPDGVGDAVMDAADRCDTPKCPELTFLADDVAALAAIFAQVMDTPYVRLRMDAVSHNACRRFHIDALTARLVCTYRGTGTQYGVAVNGQAPDQIATVPTGSPIVLRGSNWPETPLSGLLHRSPPIEGSGETRLLLVLDPVLDPVKEADPYSVH